MVVPDSTGPQPQHSPEWNKDTEEIGDHEHGLGFELKVSLDIPKSKC